MYIEKLRSLMEKAPGEAADIAEYAQMLSKRQIIPRLANNRL